MNFAEVALSVDRYSIRSYLTLINDQIIFGESAKFSSRNDIFTMILNNFNVSGSFSYSIIRIKLTNIILMEVPEIMVQLKIINVFKL